MLLASSPAVAALDCDVRIANSAGDRIDGRFNIQFSDGNVTFRVATDAGETSIWNPPSQSASPERPYFILGFNATVPNEHISSRQIAGPGGWGCWFDSIIVTPVMQVVLVAVDNQLKAAAKRWSDGFNATQTVSDGMMVVFGIIQQWQWAVTWAGIRFAAGIFKNYADSIVVDPWDYNYWAPYDPPLQGANTFGVSYCDPDPDPWLAYYCNWLIDQATVVIQNADGAYVSANRANSCAQVDPSCFSWQVARMKSFLWNEGQQLGYYALGLSNVIDYLEALGGDPEQVKTLRDIVSLYQQAAQEMQNP